MTNIILKIEGMTCNHCKMNVTKTVQNLKGVVSVDVDLEKKQAKIEFNEQDLDVDQIIETIDEIGYKAIL